MVDFDDEVSTYLLNVGSSLTKLRRIAPQKTVIFIIAAAETSNLTYGLFIYAFCCFYLRL